VADTEITVHVPSDRVTSFYEWFGHWLADDDHVVAVPKGSVLPPRGRKWKYRKDDAIARDVLFALAPAHGELIALLVDQPGVPVSWRTIITRCGGSTAADVAQLVAGIALAASARDRTGPVRWVEGGDGATYWLDNAASAFWKSALADPPRPANANGTVIAPGAGGGS